MIDHDFTVIQVIRALGYEVENELSWAAGNELRKVYQEFVGELPEKRLRRKTSGRGSHCFAVYPRSYAKDAMRIVGAVAERLYSERARQMGLFDQEPEGNSPAAK